MPDDRLDDARPTLFLDGKEDANLRQGMLSLLVAERTDGLYRCELALGNQGSDGKGVEFLYFDRRTIDFGKALRVDYKGTLFEGRITGLEARFGAKGTPELVVLAEDALQGLRMVRRTRTFEQKSDADVCNAIADDHGLDKDVTLPGPTHALLAQLNQSDLAFLRERARAVEAELWVAAGSGRSKLIVKKRAARQGSPKVKLGWKNELTEFTVLADLAGQRTSVVASGWDVAGKAAVTHEATDQDLSSELGSTDSGASILRSKFGERKESLAHTVPWTQAEVEARAKACFALMARRFVTGQGVARTTGKLRVGAAVDLDGLGPLFNGTYYLSEVRHRFDGARGLRTEIGVERAGLGRP
jgi:uncharacterized protein